MFFGRLMAAVGACFVIAGIRMADAAESNVYWRVDLNQGTSVIAYGQGSTEEAAWEDCRRLRAITRAMTSAETRKGNVSAVTTQAVRWCKNPMQLATVRPDPVVPTCAPAPADRVLACPAPTVGSWTQRATVAPDCTITWSPLTTPAGACTTPPPSGTASLSWTPPTLNLNGTALTNLAGHRIVYGTSAQALAQTIQVPGPTVSTYSVSGLPPGTYFFAVRAYTTAGTESDPSNIVQKSVP